MKRISLLILSQLLLASAMAQCSICTKTAGQIGQEAGKGFNAGIIYLAAMPFAIAGFIAFKWWQKERN
jgi:hypothetical protein